LDGADNFVSDISKDREYTDRPAENVLSPDEFMSLKGIALEAVKIRLLLSFNIGF
jgi:hypothetical protein